MKFNKFIYTGIIVILALFISSEVFAIPSFARRYKLSCTTCHSPVPKLKPYGLDFAGNGFILKEEEKERDYITAGDDLLWLNKEFPIAVRFDAYAVRDDNNEVKNDLETPYGLKLLSGGTLYKNIGYYFYFYMSEAGEVAGIEDAYIHFDNVFQTNLDIMVGQFQTSDPLMKRELRLTFEDYKIYKQTIGDANTNLTYDRGIMLSYSIDKTGTDIVGMVVNGSGKDPATNDKFDNDGNKNYGIRVAQSVGEHLTIGGFYYYAKQSKYRASQGSTRLDNEITYIGPDVNITAGPLELTTQYLIRKDSNAFFFNPNVLPLHELETKGIIAELIYSPKLDKSRYYFIGLYNQIDADMSPYNYESATLNFTYLIARNLKVLAEYTRDLEIDKNRFTIGMVTGF